MNIYRFFGFALYVFLICHRISPNLSSCPNYLDLGEADFLLLFEGNADGLEPSSALSPAPGFPSSIIHSFIIGVAALKRASVFFTPPLPFKGRTPALGPEVFWKIISSYP